MKLKLSDRLVWFALLFGCLFSGLPGPSVLGELRGEGAFFVALSIIFLAASRAVQSGFGPARSMVVWTLAFIATIMASYIANLDDVLSAAWGARSGTNKFLTASLVVAFYAAFAMALSTYARIYGTQSIVAAFARSAPIAAACEVFICLIEIASWQSTPLRHTLASINDVWNSNTAFQLNRLYGFAFEPSFQAIPVLGLSTLLAYRILASERGTRRAADLLALIGLLALQPFNGSRTFWVAATSIGAAALVWFFVRNRAIAFWSIVGVIAGPIAIHMYIALTRPESAAFYQSTSDVTRSANVLAAVKMWLSSPVFGHGFGQYGFQYRMFAPGFAQYSWESTRFLFSHDVEFLPPSYNLYTRLLAETGLLGLVVWVSLPAVLLWRALSFRGSPDLSRTEYSGLTCLTLGLVGMLVINVSLDSVRVPFFWIFLALGLALCSELNVRGVRRPIQLRTAHHAFAVRTALIDKRHDARTT